MKNAMIIQNPNSGIGVSETTIQAFQNRLTSLGIKISIIDYPTILISISSIRGCQTPRSETIRFKL